MNNENLTTKNPLNRNSYGSIFLRADKKVYHAGDSVTGKVYLQIARLCSKSLLILDFYGNETLKNTSRKNGHIKSSNVVYEPILKYKFKIHRWESLQAGQYEIPFTFSLPKNIPSSFQDTNYSYKASIEYEIGAYLYQNTETELILKHGFEMTIRDKIELAPKDFFQKITNRVTACCCIPMGSRVLHVVIENTHLAPKATALALIEIDNSKCKLACIDLTLFIRHKLKIRSESGIQTFYRSLGGCSLATIPAGHKTNKNLSLKMPDFYNKGSNSDEFVPPTTRGKLITSEVVLEVRCRTDSFFSRPYGIECPIQLIYPEPEIQKEPLAFSNNSWNPENYQMVYLKEEQNIWKNTTNNMNSDKEVIGNKV